MGAPLSAHRGALAPSQPSSLNWASTNHRVWLTLETSERKCQSVNYLHQASDHF
jgi:hypothetical protein